jgi:glycosyltransferase involved in cell wall biosynthesis
VKTYTGLGFNAERVYPWAYFVSVELPARNERTGTEQTKKIIYAGRLEDGKGIARFVSELSTVKDGAYELDIYGGGPDEEKLKFFVADKKLGAKIKFYPFLKYDELVKQYVHYDWVVLPSTKKDGWGVIISEGLLNGLKAICSNICGVSWAVQNGVNGAVFDWAQEGSCGGAIEAMLNSNTFAGRDDIKKWAEGALSSNAGARYYLQIIESTYNGAPKPKAPWL